MGISSVPPWRGTRYTNVATLGGNPIPALGPAAYYKYNTGVAVSQWDDQSGNARHLTQGVALNQPTIAGDGALLFDGAAQFMQTAGFTLNQPYTIYLRAKQVTWTANDRIVDGVAAASRLFQVTATPSVSLNAGGGAAAANTNWAVNTYASVCFVVNGASSSILVDATTETTGNPGTNNPGGITLAAANTGLANWANIQVKEVAVFTSAHDADTRARVNAYLGTL